MIVPLINTTLPLDGAFRTVAEEAALMWLEPLHIRQGGYLRGLDHYNGEMDTEEGRMALFARVQGNLPIVLVATGDESFKRMGRDGKNYESSCELEVIVASDHRRSRESANVGDEQGLNDAAIDPGCFRIMQDVFTRLCNRTTGDERMTRYTPKFTRVIVQAPEFTMWRVRFDLAWILGVFSDAELDSPGAIVDFLHQHNLADSDDPPPDSINPVAEGLTSV